MIETTTPLSDLIKSKETILPNTATTTAPGARKKLLKLEAIRGFAAFYVICYHTLPKYTVIAGKEFALFRYSQEAVIVFFILSGFVIQYAYTTSSNKSFKSFFLKRFLRIYIPLVCVFAVHYCIVAITGQIVSDSDWTSLAGNLLMLQQIPETWHHAALFHPFLGNQPLWSLTFEWWFYMIFFFAYNRFGGNTSRVVYMCGIMAALTYLIYPFILNRELMYLVIWWAGADVAKLYINKQDINIKNLLAPLASLSVITLIVVCNVFLYEYSHPDEQLTLATSPLIEVRHFGFSAVALVAAIGWRKVNWAGFRYTVGLFEPLAAISFTLYISHWFLISNAKYLDPYISNGYLRTLAYFLICCLFCYIVERIIYPRASKQVLKYFSVKKKPFIAVG